MSNAPSKPVRPFRPKTPGKKPFRKTGEDGGKPFKPREARGERKPFKPREDRGDRPFRPREDKPFRSREDRGERKPFRPREDRGDKPFRPREDRGERPFRPREDKPFRSREDRGERKPFKPREDRGDRPFRPREDKPFRSREDRGERKPFKPREDRGDRPFRPREDKPFRSREDRGGYGAEKPSRFKEKKDFREKGEAPEVFVEPPAAPVESDSVPEKKKLSLKGAKPFEKRTYTPEPKEAGEARKFDKAPEEFRPKTRSDYQVLGLSPVLNVMVNAVMKAGRALLYDFGTADHGQAAPPDFVENIRERTEKKIVALLQKAKPEYDFLLPGREAPDRDSDAEFRWILHPLDGADNFGHGLPFFAIAAALEQGGKIVASSVYNPGMDELFYAEKGQGAYHLMFGRTRRLRVSDTEALDGALAAAGPSVPFEELSSAGLVSRHLGAASLELAYAAAGRLDVFYRQGLKPWEAAAGILMVREAGGVVSDFGEHHEDARILSGGAVFASNQILHRSLQRLLSR